MGARCWGLRGSVAPGARRRGVKSGYDRTEASAEPNHSVRGRSRRPLSAGNRPAFAAVGQACEQPDDRGG